MSRSGKWGRVGPVRHLGVSEGGAKLAAKGWAYDEMIRRLAEVY